MDQHRFAAREKESGSPQRTCAPTQSSMSPPGPNISSPKQVSYNLTSEKSTAPTSGNLQTCQPTGCRTSVEGMPFPNRSAVAGHVFSLPTANKSQCGDTNKSRQSPTQPLLDGSSPDTFPFPSSPESEDDIMEKVHSKEKRTINLKDKAAKAGKCPTLQPKGQVVQPEDPSADNGFISRNGVEKLQPTTSDHGPRSPKQKTVQVNSRIHNTRSKKVKTSKEGPSTKDRKPRKSASVVSTKSSSASQTRGASNLKRKANKLGKSSERCTSDEVTQKKSRKLVRGNTKTRSQSKGVTSPTKKRGRSPKKSSNAPKKAKSCDKVKSQFGLSASTSSIVKEEQIASCANNQQQLHQTNSTSWTNGDEISGTVKLIISKNALKSVSSVTCKDTTVETRKVQPKKQMGRPRMYPDVGVSQSAVLAQQAVEQKLEKEKQSWANWKQEYNVPMVKTHSMITSEVAPVTSQSPVVGLWESKNIVVTTPVPGSKKVRPRKMSLLEKTKLLRSSSVATSSSGVMVEEADFRTTTKDVTIEKKMKGTKVPAKKRPHSQSVHSTKKRKTENSTNSQQSAWNVEGEMYRGVCYDQVSKTHKIRNCYPVISCNSLHYPIGKMKVKMGDHVRVKQSRRQPHNNQLSSVGKVFNIWVCEESKKIYLTVVWYNRKKKQTHNEEGYPEQICEPDSIDYSRGVGIISVNSIEEKVTVCTKKEYEIYYRNIDETTRLNPFCWVLKRHKQRFPSLPDEIDVTLTNSIYVYTPHRTKKRRSKVSSKKAIKSKKATQSKKTEYPDKAGQSKAAQLKKTEHSENAQQSRITEQAEKGTQLKKIPQPKKAERPNTAVQSKKTEQSKKAKQPEKGMQLKKPTQPKMTDQSKKAQQPKKATKQKKTEQSKKVQQTKKAEQAENGIQLKKATQPKMTEKSKKTQQPKKATQKKKTEQAKKAQQAKKAEQPEKGMHSKKAPQPKKAERPKKAKQPEKVIQLRKSTQPKMTEQSKKAQQPKKATKQKKTEQSKKVQQAKKAEQPENGIQLKKATQPKMTQQSKKTQQPKKATKQKKTEQSKKVQQAKKAEQSEKGMHSKKAPQPKMAGQSKKTEHSKKAEQSKKGKKSQSKKATKSSKVTQVNKDKKLSNKATQSKKRKLVVKFPKKGDVKKKNQRS